MYRKTLQAVSLATALSVAGIAGAQDENSKNDDREVLARVNGEPITRAEAQAMVEQSGQGQQSLSDLSSSQREQLIDRLVEMTLVADEARNQGFADRPKIKAQLKVSEKLTLARAMIQQVNQNQDAISEDDVRAAYEAKYGGEEQASELKARHILVDDEAKAEELIKQLDEGADFAELAKEHSTGPSKKKGGDLGWFAPDDMVNAFSDAAMGLDEGEYTNTPVKTQYGFHVIKLNDKRQSEQPSFQDKRQELRRELANDRITQFIDDLRADADIEVMSDSGNSAKEGSE